MNPSVASPTPSANPRSHSIRYRTIDLVVVVLMGVAAGVAFFSFAALIALARPLIALFPPSEGFYAGVWPIPGLLAMLIIRKPGAALATMWIGALIEAGLGSHFGWTVLISGAIVASGSEVVGLVSRYRVPARTHLIFGALTSMILQWVWEQFVFFPEWQWAFRFAHLGLFIISGIVILGYVTPALTRALARTGALSAFPLGKEEAQESRG